MSRRTRWWTGLVLLGVGAVIGAAAADRRATAPPLVYSGVVLEGASPISDGSHSIGLTLFAASSGGTAICTITPSATATNAGHFSILVADAACGRAMQTAEEVWVQLSVDGTMLSRGRVGSVPYAVQAERTVFREGTASITSGLYCGATAAVSGRIHGTSSSSVLGYLAAHELCAAACTSPTAHMCTTDEMIREWSLGRTDIQMGWVAGASAQDADCGGYTINSGGTGTWALAAVLSGSEGPGFGLQSCSVMEPVLCCD